MNLTLAMIGIVSYAAVNVVIAHKFSGISPFVVIPIYTLFVAVVTFGIGRAANGMGHELSLPGNTLLVWLLVIGVLLVVGDLAYAGAYSVKGASLSTITTCAAFLPIISVAIEKIFVGGSPPSLRTMCGFALAVFTVWLVAFDPANVPIKN